MGSAASSVRKQPLKLPFLSNTRMTINLNRINPLSKKKSLTSVVLWSEGPSHKSVASLGTTAAAAAEALADRLHQT